MKSRANASKPGFTESVEGIFEPMARMSVTTALLSKTILLAAPEGLIRSVMAEILATHGYKVLNESPDGLSAVVMGQSYPGAIHVLVASMDYRGRGKGPALAENLAHLRPRMEAIYFSEAGEELWLIRDPGTDAEIRTPFNPGILLEWIAGLPSSAAH